MNTKTILQEAFEKFELLEEETFNLSSPESASDAEEFMNASDALDMLDVIDPDVTEYTELEDSYLDKVILDCNVCHSKIYKDPEDIHISEDGESVNEDEECPFCYSTDGFVIVGQVKPYEETEYDVTIEPKEIEESCSKTSKRLPGGVTKRSKQIKESSTQSRRLKEGWTTSTKPVKDIEKSLKSSGKNYVKFITHLDMDMDGTPDENRLGDDGITVAKNVSDDTVIILDEFDRAPKELQDFLKTTLADKNVIAVLVYPRLGHYAESLENIDVETKHDKIHIEAEEKADSDFDMVAPLDPEVEDEIMLNSDEEEFEEIPEEDGAEEVEYDIDEFDEDSFDELGEAYLTKVYENVNSFETSSVSQKGNKWMVEGKIHFKSGNTKPTKFIFEAYSANGKGKLNFVGHNSEITRGKKSFNLSGVLDNKKFISESLRYNYRQKDSTGKSVRVYGTSTR